MDLFFWDILSCIYHVRLLYSLANGTKGVMTMNTFHTWQKKFLAVTLAGTAAFTLGAAPLAMAAEPAETASETTAEARAPRPGHMPPMRPFQPDFRINKMVKEGKITQEQADKLKKAIADFQEKQAKERKKFMKGLPGKTGISKSTLRELMVPRRFRHGPGPRLQQGQQGTQNEAPQTPEKAE